MVPENNAASWHQDMHPRRPRSPCPPIPFHPRHCPRKQKIRLYTPQKIGRIKRHPLLLLCVSQCAPGTKRYTKRFCFSVSCCWSLPFPTRWLAKNKDTLHLVVRHAGLVALWICRSRRQPLGSLGRAIVFLSGGFAAGNWTASGAG